MVNEPVGLGALFVAFVNAVLAFVVIVGIWNATPEQLAAASLVIVTGAVFAQGYLVRKRVTPNK